MRSANTKFFLAQSVMQNAVHIGNLTKENVNVIDSLVGILHYVCGFVSGVEIEKLMLKYRTNAK